jgi:hypothetical protein
MGKDCQVWQYATAIVSIIAVAALAANGTVDSSVFASLVTLCLGYVFGRTMNPSNGNGAK